MNDGKKRRIDIEPDEPQDPVTAPGQQNDKTGRKPNPVSEPDAGIEEPGEGEGTPTEVDIPNEDL